MLLFGAETHHEFDAGSVIPAAIEDYDLTAGGKTDDIALHEHLGLFAVRWSRQRRYPEHAWAHPFGHGSDRPALTCSIAPLKDNNRTKSLVFDPLLKFAKLCLEASKFLRVLLITHPIAVLAVLFF